MKKQEYIKQYANATAMEKLTTYMIERYTIKSKRDNGLPAPWTTNLALKNYSFTNLNRDEDKDTIRVSIWTQQLHSRKWRAIAAFIMRFLQNMDEFSRVFRNIYHELFNESSYALKIQELKDSDFLDNLATGVYKVEQNYKVGKLKRTEVLDRIEELASVIDEKTFNSLATTKEVMEYLSALKGFGTFFTAQITLDLRIIEPALKVDEVIYHAAGTERGTVWLLTNKDLMKIKKKQYFPGKYNNYDWERIKKDLLEQTYSYLHGKGENAFLMYLQGIMKSEPYNWNNILCEFQKYCNINDMYEKEGRLIFLKCKRKGRYE